MCKLTHSLSPTASPRAIALLLENEGDTKTRLVSCAVRYNGQNACAQRRWRPCTVLCRYMAVPLQHAGLARPGGSLGASAAAVAQERWRGRESARCGMRVKPMNFWRSAATHGIVVPFGAGLTVLGALGVPGQS